MRDADDEIKPFYLDDIRELKQELENQTQILTWLEALKNESKNLEAELEQVRKTLMSFESIAFCCISTGVFGFPQREAAKIAVDTVRRYKAKTGSKIKVIFNVFKDEDLGIYQELLPDMDP